MQDWRGTERGNRGVRRIALHIDSVYNIAAMMAGLDACGSDATYDGSSADQRFLNVEL